MATKRRVSSAYWCCRRPYELTICAMGEMNREKKHRTEDRSLDQKRQSCIDHNESSGTGDYSWSQTVDCYAQCCSHKFLMGWLENVHYASFLFVYLSSLFLWLCPADGVAALSTEMLQCIVVYIHILTFYQVQQTLFLQTFSQWASQIHFSFSLRGIFIHISQMGVRDPPCSCDPRNPLPRPLATRSTLRVWNTPVCTIQWSHGTMKQHYAESHRRECTMCWWTCIRQAVTFSQNCISATWSSDGQLHWWEAEEWRRCTVLVELKTLLQ